MIVPDLSRRSLLGGLGTAALVGVAGCSYSLASSHGATDVVLHNESKNALDVAVKVTRRSADAPRIDTSVALNPHARHTFNNDVLMNGDYDVYVRVTRSDTGSKNTETHEWNDADHTLHVLIDEEIVFAVQVG